MTDEAEERTARVRALTSYDPHNLTLDQVRLIKDTVARGATDDELRLFVAVCGQTGLNPFARQIHFVKRWDSALGREAGTFQTGIDGYRLIAQRTGDYIGQTETKWCGGDGQWKDVWLSEEPPAAAKVGVLRRGFEKPLWGVARWKAYHQTRKDGSPNAMWARYDAEQLAKCAEALALRKAFPQELAGVYADEEFEHAAQAVLPASSLRPDAVTVEDLAPPDPSAFPAPVVGPAPAVVSQAPVQAVGLVKNTFTVEVDEVAPVPPTGETGQDFTPPPEGWDPGGPPHEDAALGTWDGFASLVAKARKHLPGRTFAKEAPAGSGKWYLIDAECARDLGYQGGLKILDSCNRVVSPPQLMRIGQWLRRKVADADAPPQT